MVKIKDSSNNDVAEYDYDPLGRRIRLQKDFVNFVPFVVTLFYYNPDWQCLSEYDATGPQAVQLRYFVYGNYIDEPLVMRRQSDGKDYHYGHDHLHSTAILLDDTGSVVERCEYDACGTAHITDASYNPRTASAYNNPYTFTGRRLDVLDGGNLVRMHYRYRDYEPYTGRFMQHDPLSYIDGLSLYQYATANPIVRLDPKGTYVHDPGGVLWPGGYPITTPSGERDIFVIIGPYGEPIFPPYELPYSRSEYWVECGDIREGTHPCQRAADKACRGHCELRRGQVGDPRGNQAYYPVWRDTSNTRAMSA